MALTEWTRPVALLAAALLVACGGGDDVVTPDAAADAAPPDAAEPEPDAAEPDPDAAADMGPPDDVGPPVDAAPPPDAAPPEPDMASVECPECPGGLVCDMETGACVETGECAGDDDCLDGRHCAEGVCVDDCLEDAACPGTRACDLDSGRCLEAAPCFVPEDCDAGRLCLDGGCVDACGPDAPCPGNQACGEDGRCVEGDGCAADDDCVGARICVLGECTAPCAEDADCPGTRRCDVVTGQCPEPDACFAEGDCDPGRVCDDGVCAGVCEADDDCPGRQLCGDDGRCAEPAMCLADEDCRGARLCLDGACADPCRENADCPGALTCDLDTGRCGEAPQGCNLSADCIGDRLCVDRVCVDPECSENAECDIACVDRICGVVPVACAGDAACPGETRCAPIGVCADDRPCAGDGDCDGLRPVCLGGRCAACATDLDCAVTEFCDAGTCVFFDGCGEDADCPGRRQCAGGQCVAAPCAGDVFDEARDVPTVAARTYTGLVLCDGDTDTYRIELAADEGLQVTLRHDRLEGDLATRLTAPGSPDLVYARSDGDGIEVVGLPPSPAPQIVDLVVDGRIGFDTAYQLTIERLPVDGCPPDPSEVPFDNDERRRATPISAAPRAVGLCPGDVDWLGFDLAAGTELTVTAVSEAVPDVLVIDLVDPADAVLASARVEERDLVLTGVAAETGPHALRIADAEEPTALELTFATAAGPGAVAAACADAPRAAFDDPAPLPSTLPVDRFELGCAAGAAAPEHVVRLDLAAASTVEFAVRPDDRQTTVAVRRACEDADSEVACVFGADGEVELEAGAWYLFVESSGAVPQTLELRRR